MLFIGVDLAWGEKAQTGLCAVDANGVVLESATAFSLEEIVVWCRRYTECDVTKHDVLVAVDAPLIVNNLTGQRNCESIISKCYGGRGASAHSSNLGMAHFASGSRASKLALELDLTSDPVFVPQSPVRRIIEVYPHPAIVTLFDLENSLPYKAKGKRDFALRFGALRQLVAMIEGLADADLPLSVAAYPRWAQLKSSVERATSGGQLDRVEDELDAYICAYVGLYYWHHGAVRCRVVGSLRLGYIVTPVSSEDGETIDRLMAV